MATETPGTYCQNCFTWNPGDRETCRKCGTRLLIVAGDQGWDDEVDNEQDDDLDEHLLERITGLEENLRRIETYLEAISDQLGKLERSEVMLRNGLMSLVQEMEQKGQLDGHAFSSRWEELVEENLQLIGARELFTRYRARILPIAKPKSMSQLRRALLETSALLDMAKLPEAANRLAQALAMDSKNYELLFTVAALKEVAQDLDEAENLVRKVVQLSPRHFEAWMLLAKLLRDDLERADEAIEALHKAAELRPDEAEPRIQLCEVLLDEEDLQGALEAATDALNLQRDGHTLSLMGEVLLARGDAAKAIPLLKEASVFLPGELFVRELLAEGYLLADERPKAFAILEELLRQNPGDHELLLLLDAENPAQLRSARGGTAISRMVLDEVELLIREGATADAAVCLKPTLRKERSERAEFLELQIAFLKHPKANISKALAFAASKRHPRLCFQALRLVLDILMEQNADDKLQEALSTYMTAHPKSSGAWEAAVIHQACRLMAGDISDEDLQEVKRLQANPLPGQEGRARTLLGQYLLDLKRPAEVVDLLGPVLKNEPTLINHFQLGTALAALRREDEALDVLEAGLEADPHDLQESQIAMVHTKMKALIQELDQSLSQEPQD
ncbi:tetratricopeptide repeat protein [Holophaga foetida]|uniref:tetratricopeptide repeat protein n=1 Tax=Holophaga foetida TaxID=35839 RepID=UPI0002473365|nr:tetratricopeptide repeat protein [Holophaga foetida]